MPVADVRGCEVYGPMFLVALMSVLDMQASWMDVICASYLFICIFSSQLDAVTRTGPLALALFGLKLGALGLVHRFHIPAPVKLTAARWPSLQLRL